MGCRLPPAREWRWKGFCKGLREQAVNWLDILITVAWIMGLFLGWRMGLFGAIFAAGGAVVGVFLAARFSDDIADLLTNSVSSDTLATVIAYVVILAAVFAAGPDAQVYGEGEPQAGGPGLGGTRLAGWPWACCWASFLQELLSQLWPDTQPIFLLTPERVQPL